VTGVPSQVLGAPSTWINAIEFNHLDGSLHFVHSVDSHEWIRLDLVTGTQTVVDNSHPGSGPFSPSPNGTAMAINDLMHRTEVFPKHPSSSAGFTLAATAHGAPGDFAGLAVTAVNGVPVFLSIGSIGICSPGGHFPVQAPIAPGALPPGTVFSVTAGTLDPATLVLTFGQPVDVVVGL
jgi:hypothetical protein